MNDSRKTGLLRLCHLREHTEAIAERFYENRKRFERLADNASAPRVVSAFNLFQTPEPLAEIAVSMLERGGRTLEPSAGLGRLYRAIRKTDKDCEIVLVEQAAECAGELFRQIANDERAKLLQGDFLALDSNKLGLFDRIIMNPPFKMGRDVQHIERAAQLLSPGGRLVAFCATGSRREKLRERATHWRKLPPGSFKSEGTGVEAAIVVIDN